MQTSRLGLSVVIPCYNEEAGISELFQRLLPVCQKTFPNNNFEIVIVNDGSTDSTWSHITEAASVNPFVTAVNLTRNHGHQLALTAGLNVCRGDRIFILDADLQDPPELLPDMMAKMDEGYDVVYGQRSNRTGETFFKRTSANLFYRLLKRLVEIDIPLDTGDFRLMSRRVLTHLQKMPERYRFIRGMVSWVGYKQTALSYDRDARFAGTTHYPLHKMFALAIDAVTSFSTVPLKIASLLGVVFGICGMASLVWIMISYFSGGTVTGWASLAAIVLTMGSIQLIFMGVFGEYLGRMYMESKQRPLFMIDEIISPHNTARAPTKNHMQEFQDTLKEAING